MVRVRVLLAAGVVGLGVIAVACGLDVSGSGGGDTADGGDPDATVDVVSHDAPDTGGDEGVGNVEGGPGRDGGSDAKIADGAPDAYDSGCVALQPPAMVRVGSVCIDVTEVTNDQYRAFLASPAPPTPSSVCTWNTSFVPDAGTPLQDTLPVLVNWCNAQAYCQWAGKRLCGKLGGGSLPDNNDPEDPTKGQWAHACTNGGDASTIYPYGATYDASACGTPVIHPVGVLGTCQGPVQGLFDMSGNVWEWTDACNGSSGQQDDCALMGGQYNSGDPNQLKCRNHVSGKRADQPFGATGFRCCSP